VKFYAASVPRSVRAARLGHLRTEVIIGTWYIQNPGGANQVFDVVMQPEAEFLRTKNHLASPAMNASLQQGPRRIFVKNSSCNNLQTAAFAETSFCTSPMN
jgi:hypothetical protein